jgi:hypothetical protein
MARLTDDEQKALVHNLEDIILRQGEQIKKLEAALAKCDPWATAVMPSGGFRPVCWICGVLSGNDHSPDCLWRQAKAGQE